MAGASSSGVSCVVEVSPLADALLPTYQMKDLRRLEASIRHTLCTLEREEKHFRVVLLVVLSSSLYFAWNPLSRAYACIRAWDVVGWIQEIIPLLVGVAFLIILYRQPAFYEKIHETTIYVRRLNESLRQLHLFFDQTSLSLFICQKKNPEEDRRMSFTSSISSSSSISCTSSSSSFTSSSSSSSSSLLSS